MLDAEAVAVLQRLSLQCYAQLLFLNVQALILILAPAAAAQCSFIKLDLYHVTSKCESPPPLNTEVSVNSRQGPTSGWRAAGGCQHVRHYQASSVRASRRCSNRIRPQDASAASSCRLASLHADSLRISSATYRQLTANELCLRKQMV